MSCTSLSQGGEGRGGEGKGGEGRGGAGRRKWESTASSVLVTLV